MRIRRVNSYRNLSIHQLSGMNSPGFQRTERVRPTPDTTAPFSEMPQLNKYTEQRKHATTTVSDFARNRNALTSSEGFKTVTLHLEKYEQLRRDQETLQALEQELQNMIRLVPQPPSEDGVENVRIEIDKHAVQAYAKRKLENEHSTPADQIDCSDIQLI